MTVRSSASADSVVALASVEQLRCGFRVAVQQLAGQAEVHRKGDHTSLRAVVEVALDALELSSLDV